MAEQEQRIPTLVTRNIDVSSLPKFGESVKDDIVDFLIHLELALKALL